MDGSPDLFEYPLHPGWKRGETSAAAAAHVAPVARTLRDKCLAVLRASSGLTADEVAARLGLSILTVRPRISELANLGKVKASDARRKNESGLSARVWVASGEAGQ